MAVSLTMEAFQRGITPPAAQTLKTYGMSADEWIALLKAQDWKCPICMQGNDRPKTGKQALWNTDHEHVPGWAKMPPERRKTYVRGVLCHYCNHRRVNSRMESAEAQRIADYIRAYEQRNVPAPEV